MSSSRDELVTIKSLPLMEDLVSQSTDLEWDGWNVLKFGGRASVLNPKARKVNGQWQLVDYYPVTENGWEVPYDLAT